MSYIYGRCQHIFIDTGMKTTWCKKCEIRGEYNFMKDEFTVYQEDGKINVISIDAHRMLQEDRLKQEEISNWKPTWNIDDEEEII